MDKNFSPPKGRALVVLSGGQDSVTCLFWALRYFGEVHAVTFNYGQLHAREIQAARDIAVLANIASHEVIDLGSGILASTSPLVNSAEELEKYSSFEAMEEVIGTRVEKTFVPMRNQLFLTIAANRAVALNASHIVTGVCQEDNANYPDCRDSFIRALDKSINLSLGVEQKLTIVTPLMDLSKARSVELAMNIDAYPFLAFSHTAYDGLYPPVGTDHASTLRAKGFELAGVPDPLVVRAVAEGLMTSPTTENYTSPYAATLCAALALEIGQMKTLLHDRFKSGVGVHA